MWPTRVCSVGPQCPIDELATSSGGSIGTTDAADASADDGDVKLHLLLHRFNNNNNNNNKERNYSHQFPVNSNQKQSQPKGRFHPSWCHLAAGTGKMSN